MQKREFFFRITKDLLVSLIITYFFLSIPELILPGLISSHFNPKYLLVFIIALGWLFAFQGKGNAPRENTKFRAISRNLLNLILFVVTVMLVLSLYKMKLWQIAIVTAFSIALFVAAEKMFVSREEES
jgi:cell division protein FtsW (lipid II flippase)